MKDDTATFDERAHIPAAYSYVRYGDMRLNPEHPPLLKDLAGLPLLFLHPNFPIQSELWTNGITKAWQFGTAMWSTWDIGSAFLYHGGNDAESILFWSRLPIVLLSLLLSFFIYRFTRELAGTGAGLFATLLFALDPNVLAHDHYVTTDLGIAAFIFIATYYFVHFLKNPSPKNIVIAGLTLGLAQLAKFSAVILIPLFGLLVIIHTLTQQSSSSADNSSQSRFQSLCSSIFDYLKILIIAFAVIWISYLANTWNMPAEKTMLHANLVFSGDAAPDVVALNVIDTLANTPGLAPLAHYMLGVFMVFSRITGGNTNYFLGNIIEPSLGESNKAYFPVVFFLKETLPLIFLIVFTVAYTVFLVIKPSNTTTTASWRERFSHSFQAHTPQYTNLSFVALYAYLSVSGNLNIGFRHLFPILPFISVLVTVTLFHFMKNCSLKANHTYCATRHLFNIFLGGFSFWIAVIPFLAFPDYLSYFNESVGAENGHRYVVDSNYDWGQNLKRLKIWVDTYNQCVSDANNLPQSSCDILANTHTYPTHEAIDNLNIDYYGGSEVNYYFKEGAYTLWHSNNTPQSGWFAISATFFEENTHKVLKPGETDYSWLSKYQPIGRAGNSMFIFHVSPESLGR
ncbi:MAG: ArnT family glycosyltransferase [Methylococcales bacterium]